MQEEYNVTGYDPETGEVLKEKAKKTMDKTWGTRLDDETTDKLEQIAAEEGLDKRELLKYFIDLRSTANLKARTRGKEDVINGIEDKLNGIRRQMNELLEQNIEAEEVIRGSVADEMKDLESTIKKLKDELADQVGSNKELKEEVKKLKAELKDAEKEKEKMIEDHKTTKTLNEQYEEKLNDYNELKTKVKDLEASNHESLGVIDSLRKDISAKEMEVVNANKEVEQVKNLLSNREVELTSKIEEISNLKALHLKDLSTKEELYQAQLEGARTAAKAEHQEKIMEYMQIETALKQEIAELQKQLDKKEKAKS